MSVSGPRTGGRPGSNRGPRQENIHFGCFYRFASFAVAGRTGPAPAADRVARIRWTPRVQALRWHDPCGAAASGDHMKGLLQDVKYGYRALRKRTLVSSVAVLMLGLGTASSAAIFSALQTLAFRPLP